MAMIGKPTQACIQEAFSNRTLMGMGLLDGFESGCGCGELSGLGVPDGGDDGIGVPLPMPPTPADICGDTSSWAIRKGVDGKCYNYCTLDITQQYEVEASACAIGSATAGVKIKPKTMDMNTMLIIGIGVTAFLLARQ